MIFDLAWTYYFSAAGRVKFTATTGLQLGVREWGCRGEGEKRGRGEQREGEKGEGEKEGRERRGREGREGDT